MSIDIQKQLDLKPYSDINVGKKQVVETSVQVQQPVDEEKSNAAKWMIGLTATAAIVVGGLWAAKKGHLGEGAEKFAKKLLGETKDAKPKGDTKTSDTTSTTTTAGTTGSTGASGSSPAATITNMAAIIPPLVVARKAVSKLIKSPKNLSETIQSLQDAGVAFERTENCLAVKTGKKMQDITYIIFDNAGTSCAITRPNKKNVIEAFEINNGTLASVTRRFDGLKLPQIIGSKQKEFFKPLTHKVQLDDKRKVIEETWEVAENQLDHLTLTSVKGIKDSFNANMVSVWQDFLSKHGDELPKRFEKVKIYPLKEAVKGDYDGARYLTARVAKYWKKPLKDIPQDIPSEEFARFLYYKSEPHFSDVVDALNVERRIARRVSDVKLPSEDVAEYVTVHRNNSGEIADIAKIKEEFKEFFYNDKSGRKAEVFTRLFKDDLGPINSFNEGTIVAAVKSYNAKFKAYGLDKNIELMDISTKPLKDCSFDDLIKIFEVVCPQRAGVVLKDPFENVAKEKEFILKYLGKITGISSIDENTKLFDLLQHLN